MGTSNRVQSTWLLIGLILIWGVNWPLSKLALTYAPPILFSGVRTIVGGLLLLIVALPRYKKLRLRETWYIYLISSVVNIILYYGLQTVGLTYLPSGLFSAIVFLQPVLVGVFAWMWLSEPMFGLKLFGLFVGFAGVGVISIGGLSAHISFVGILLALGSALSWALGTIYVKKIGALVDPIWLVTMQLIIGGLFMSGLGTEVESWSSIVWSPTFVACLLFISIFVIALGWLVFYKLIGSGEASKVAAYTFLIPVVAIVTGILFLDEPFTLSLLGGLLLIILSILCVNRKPKRLALSASIPKPAK